jgi:hypothetical protein
MEHNTTNYQFDEDGLYAHIGFGFAKFIMRSKKDFTWPVIFIFSSLTALFIGYKSLSFLFLFGIIVEYTFYNLRKKNISDSLRETENNGTIFQMQPEISLKYEDVGEVSTGDNNFQNMKIKSRENIQLNITAVFSEIDHAHITAEKMREVFGLTEEEKRKSPFFEIPGVKSLIFPPERQKDIIFEANRIRLNDKSRKEPKDSDLVQDFYKAFENLVDKTKLIAYGFNYDILVTTEEPVEYKIFIGKKMLSILNSGVLSEGGMRMVYRKDNKRFDLQISPIVGQSKQFIVHLNVHYDATKIEDFTLIQNQFVQEYSEIQKIINQLEK